MNASSTNDDDFHSLLLEWGARRSGYSESSLGYGRSIYDRMISGLRGTTCSKCIGRGVVTTLIVSGDDVAQSKTPCPLCKGKGRVNVATRGKINPACIPSTGPGAAPASEPQIFGRIDRGLYALKVRHRAAIITRYVHYPRRSHAEQRLAAMNQWLRNLGEQPISKRYLVEELLPAAKRELHAAIYAEG